MLHATVLFGQGNLVPNYQFENTTSCPPNLVGNLAGGGVLLNWYNPNNQTPDYFNDCALSLNFLQIPYSQNGYVGIASYDPNGTNQREYVECNLLNILINNKFYWVEFYVSVGEGYTSVTSNNLGIHFSDTALHSTGYSYFDVPAQVKYFNNEIIDDTANWVKVSGIYKAHGGEAFITLGNFNTDAETTVGMEYSDGFINQTYFLIDDVSVIPLDSIPGGIPVDAGPDKTIYIGDTTFIGQKISNMPDNWFLLNGTPVDTNTAGVYVSPSVNTTYVVTRNLNGFYSTDTVTVFVNGLGLEEVKKERYSLFPVPNNGEFHLVGNIEKGFKLNIIGLDGKLTYQEVLYEEANAVFIKTGLLSGTYTVVLKNKEGHEVFRKKIVVI
jgi:hypothetical protein